MGDNKNFQHLNGYIEDTLVIDKQSLVFKDSTTGDVLDRQAVISKLTESDDSSLPKSILVDIEATHSGVTKNYTEYLSEKMKESAPSWLAPYNRPVLKEHCSGGNTLGRVRSYEFRKSVLNPEKDCIALTLEITDKDSIRRHLDGTALTYSIGAQAQQVFCGVCGIDILNSDSFCGHWKGENYTLKKGDTEEKVQCVWQIGTMEYLEVSEVNVPADVWAQKLNVRTSTNDSFEGTNTQGSLDDSTINPDTIDNLLINDSSTIDDPANPNTTTENIDNIPSPVVDVPPAKTVEDYVAEISALTTQTSELTTKVTELTNSLAEANAVNEGLVSDLNKITDSSKQTFKMNVELAKLVKRVYADHIVNAKILIEQLTESQYETEMTTLIAMTTKELQDMLDSLKSEIKARKSLPKLTNENVGDDGALGVPQANADVNTSNNTKKAKAFTAKDAVNEVLNIKR